VCSITRFISVSQGKPFCPADHVEGWTERPVRTCRDFKQDILEKTWSPIIWIDGVRKQENFDLSYFAVLDVDDGHPIDVAHKKLFSLGVSYIIAPTRSHGQPKNGRIADRYRIIMRWQKPIASVDDYKYNMALLITEWGADKACRDAARFFFPSKSIYAWGAGIGIEVRPEPAIEKERREQRISANKYNWNMYGELPGHVEAFLKEGRIFSSGRNSSCFVCAISLKEIGFSEEEAYNKIASSPFPKVDFKDSEIINAVKSAYKRAA